MRYRNYSRILDPTRMMPRRLLQYLTIERVFKCVASGSVFGMTYASIAISTRTRVRRYNFLMAVCWFEGSGFAVSTSMHSCKNMGWRGSVSFPRLLSYPSRGAGERKFGRA